MTFLSLESLSESEIEEAWLDEAERRASEIDQGLVSLVSAEEVSRKARELLDVCDLSKAKQC